MSDRCFNVAFGIEMEDKTPIPEPLPLDKFDDLVFSDFDMDQSYNSQSDIMDGSMSDRSNQNVRRTKAERMKLRQNRQKEYAPSQEINMKINSIRDNLNMSMNKNALTNRVEGKDPKTDFSQSIILDKDMSKSMKKSKKDTVVPKKISRNNMSSVNDLNKSKKKNHNKNIRYDKTRAAKAEKNRKNHISHFVRNKINKAKIVDFARKVAAKKVQRIYRDYLEEKKERERIRFEQAKKR
jgi:hypothetical protein